MGNELALRTDMVQRPSITIQLLRSRVNVLNPAHHDRSMLLDYANTDLPVVHVEGCAKTSSTSGPKVATACHEAVGILRETANDRSREAPRNWRKSGYSGQNTACVEVGRVGGGAAVRNAKDRAADYFTTDGAQRSRSVSVPEHGRFALRPTAPASFAGLVSG